MNNAEIEGRLRAIEERNKRVEADKAWEVSFFRKATIAAATYIVAVVFLSILQVEDAALSALVPAVGFILSTLSLPVIKEWWISRR